MSTDAKLGLAMFAVFAGVLAVGITGSTLDDTTEYTKIDDKCILETVNTTDFLGGGTTTTREMCEVKR